MRSAPPIINVVNDSGHHQAVVDPEPPDTSAAMIAAVTPTPPAAQFSSQQTYDDDHGRAHRTHDEALLEQVLTPAPRQQRRWRRDDGRQRRMIGRMGRRGRGVGESDAHGDVLPRRDEPLAFGQCIGGP